jgi:uncharacterized protein YpmS
MLELSLTLLAAIVVLSLVFAWNENAKRVLQKETNSKSDIIHAKRQAELEALMLSSIEDCKNLRSQLVDMKTDVASVKVSLGWSPQDK